MAAESVGSPEARRKDWADPFMWYIEWGFGPTLFLEGVAVILMGSLKGFIGIVAGLAFSMAMAAIRRGERRARVDADTQAPPGA